MKPDPVRLIIADACELFREGVRSVLDQVDWIVVVGEAEDEAGLLQISNSVDFDAVLLDMRFAASPDALLIRRLIGEGDRQCIIVSATPAEPTALRKALEAGADGFVAREAHSEALVSALSAVARGHHYIQPELLSVLLAPSPPMGDRPPGRLKPRQLSILRLVSNGLPNKQIAAELGMSETTIKADLRFIYAELDVESRAGAVAAALRNGLVE